MIETAERVLSISCMILLILSDWTNMLVPHDCTVELSTLNCFP